MQIVLLLALALLGFSGGLMAQSLPLSPPEKFIISTDRDLYIAGENVWFSATDIQSSERESHSKVLYVEFYNRNHQALVRKKLAMENGICSGSILIPEQVPSDNYFIRVYTALLRNYTPECYPVQKITVVNPDIPFSASNIPESQKCSLLLPGNTLVAGLDNQGYVYYSENYPEEMEVFLVSSLGDTLSQLQQITKGLYPFELNPSDSLSYSITSRIGNDNIVTTMLPHPSKDGFLMKLDLKPDKIIVKLSANEAGFDKLKGKSMVMELIGEKQRHKFTHTFKFLNQFQDEVIPMENLHAGIYYCRVVDIDGKTLWLSMFNNRVEEPVELSLSKKSYKQGELVDIIVNPLLPEKIIHYSIAVVKKGACKREEDVLKELILSPENQEVHLSSFLPPNLFEPAAYAFIEANSKKINRLFDERSQTISMQVIPETRAVNLSGIVRNRDNGEPMQDIPVLMSQIDDNSRVHLFRTKQDGSFAFPLYHSYQEQNLFLSTLHADSIESEIKINADFSSEYLPVPEYCQVLDSTDEQLIAQLYLNHQLSGFTAGESLLEEPVTYDSLFGFVNPDITILLEDYIDLPDMETVLNEIVPNVKVRKRRGNYRLTVLDDITEMTYHNPLVLVDNIPIKNMNRLMQIHPSQVSKVEVINKTYYSGNNLFQGVIMIKSQIGNFAGISMPEDAVFLKYQTLNPATKYTAVKQNEKSFRNTLFWQPNVLGSENQTFSFYTSQHLSDYEVVVHVVTAENNEYRVIRTIKVAK